MIVQYPLFGKKTKSLMNKYWSEGWMSHITYSYDNNCFVKSPLSDKKNDDIYLETIIKDLNETLYSEGMTTITRETSK